MHIERVTCLEEYNFYLLLDESMSEGYKFVQKLLDEYMQGDNRFNKFGESLFVAIIEKEVIGVCGLNIDPYLKFNDVGRVRHLYVSPIHRSKGVGSKLLRIIEDEARKYFRILTLYTENPIADRFYRNIGFLRAEGIDKASHVLNLERKTGV
ncbi:GNAT family N-acetyltransferase [Paenibacillus sp. 453mf]|uniref:GNAT family N-acetyltransferase n=1 Tax=Paenibacillus sp. 453mf TaxID=1761874 RepID=UPI0008E92213|nr:GNAT family N-acetyltransferase [Paenibacillus sp. 453mf]SFS56772.1 hypothetical protein SAMN04488601_1011816 [Paenibacillus sp. 453mf]